ncbi:MAG: tetratricopeptide repeat protein [Bacteroidia bacterium]
MKFYGYLCLLLLLLGPVKVNAQPLTDSLKAELDGLLHQTPAKAFSIAHSLMLQADSASHPELQAWAHDVMGEIMYYRGMYQQSLYHLITSHTIWEDLGDKRATANSLLLLGRVYYYTHQAELAEESYREALDLYEALTDRAGIGRALASLGHLAEKRGAYDTAIQLQEAALQHFLSIADNAGEADVYEHLGSIYEDLEQFPLAETYFRKALGLNQSQNNRLKAIINLNNIGDVYRKTRDYQKAEIYSMAALQLADSLRNTYQLLSALKDLAKLAFDQNNYQKAYLLLDSHRVVYNRLYNEESSLQTSLLQTLYESRQKDNRIAQLIATRRQNRMVMLLSGLLAVLLLLSTYLILNRKRLRLEKDNKLLAKEREIEEQQKRLALADLQNTKLNEAQLDSELKIKQLHEELLNKELELRGRELTTHTLQIIRKNRLLGELRDKLQKLSKSNPSEQKQIVRDLGKKIDISLVQEKEWVSFNKSFEEVHQGFYSVLHNLHPDLSAAEIRLCALIRLNMSSRDIATILGISADSLRVSRYRLKKKLGLEAEAKLTPYIHAIAVKNGVNSLINKI